MDFFFKNVSRLTGPADDGREYRLNFSLCINILVSRGSEPLARFRPTFGDLCFCGDAGAVVTGEGNELEPPGEEKAKLAMVVWLAARNIALALLPAVVLAAVEVGEARLEIVAHFKLASADRVIFRIAERGLRFGLVSNFAPSFGWPSRSAIICGETLSTIC